MRPPTPWTLFSLLAAEDQEEEGATAQGGGKEELALGFGLLVLIKSYEAPTF